MHSNFFAKTFRFFHTVLLDGVLVIYMDLETVESGWMILVVMATNSRWPSAVTTDGVCTTAVTAKMFRLPV